MEFKRKMTTYGEIFDKYLGGFKHLKYGVESWKIQYRPSCTLADFKLTNTFEVDVIHLRRLDCTYIAITCMGFLDLFGPLKSADTLVLRFDGTKKYDEIDDEVVKAALYEMYCLFEKKLEEREEEES